MKIIDLSAPIYHGMPVYPGDPEVTVEQVHDYETHLNKILKANPRFAGGMISEALERALLQAEILIH